MHEVAHLHSGHAPTCWLASFKLCTSCPSSTTWESEQRNVNALLVCEPARCWAYARTHWVCMPHVSHLLQEPGDLLLVLWAQVVQCAWRGWWWWCSMLLNAAATLLFLALRCVRLGGLLCAQGGPGLCQNHCLLAASPMPCRAPWAAGTGAETCPPCSLLQLPLQARHSQRC